MEKMQWIKPRVFIKHLKLAIDVQRINFDVRTVEVDLSNGNGDLWEFDFDEVMLVGGCILDD
jgi:hypothetical protein